MINPAPLCNTQPPFAALGWRTYEKREQQYFRRLCHSPGQLWGADANSGVGTLAPDHGA